ncbi:MAG: hypothetical protein ACF788_02265, partial [Novipirellula sp. JB048]
MSRQRLSTPWICDSTARIEATAPNRRKFLGLTSLWVAGSLASAPGGLHAAETPHRTADREADRSEITAPVSLSVNHDQQRFRVRMEIDVEGNVNIPANPLVSRTKARAIPLQSEAVFDYEERYRLPHDASPDSYVTAAERFYHEAESVNDLNDTKRHAQLRRDVAHAIVRRDTLPEIIYSTTDSFTSNELELLRTPVSSLAVDDLLPVDAVLGGDQYLIDAEVMRGLLNLSSVERCEVKAEVVAISDADARIQIRGDLDGSVEGVPTKIRVVGKLTFDRTAGITSWLALAVHETRDIGIAVPGFDVAATIKMVRQPLTQGVAMPAEPFPLDVTAAIDPAALLIELKSQQVGISTRMDRRWRMISDVRGLSMMRMIENDRSIAQCDFRRLSQLEEGKQWSMEALQANIRTTLGEQLLQLELANERVNAAGLRVLSVVARGSVQEVPIHWIIQHFSDDSGRRAMATFTMEADLLDAFDSSDVQLSETLRFIDPPGAEAATEIATRSRIVTGRQDDRPTP